MTVLARVGKKCRRLSGLVAIAVTLSSCQSALPHADLKPSAVNQVRILVDPESSKELVIGEIYVQSLAEEGRDSRLVPVEKPDVEKRLENLESREVDLIVGCTGSFLRALNPVQAEEIAEEIEQEPKAQTGKDFLKETHIALMSSLPSTLTVVEPSTAQGCEDEDADGLPQNYVALFDKNLFNRDERIVVAAVTKYLTVRDLRLLTSEAEKSGSAEEVVAKWLNRSSIEEVADDTQDGSEDFSQSR